MAKGTRNKTLLGRIKQILRTPRRDGHKGTRYEAAAEAYVAAMEHGSFIHSKEILDREEGKVAARVANADGSNLKLYSGVPLEGDDAP